MFSRRSDGMLTTAIKGLFDTSLEKQKEIEWQAVGGPLSSRLLRVSLTAYTLALVSKAGTVYRRRNLKG
jgi:hypothetical protein